MGNRPRAPTEGSDGFTQREVEPFDESGLDSTSQSKVVHGCTERVARAKQHSCATELNLAMDVFLTELTVQERAGDLPDRQPFPDHVDPPLEIGHDSIEIQIQ